MERRGNEYYLHPTLDALEAAFLLRRWGELKSAPFEHHLSHLESSAAAITFELVLFFHGLLARLSSSNVEFFLGCASLGRIMFEEMQQDYHRMKDKYEEVVRAGAKYREELYISRNELKRATEVVTSCRQSLMALEKEKKYADLERDRAKVDLEKAKTTLQDQEKAL